VISTAAVAGRTRGLLSLVVLVSAMFSASTGAQEFASRSDTPVEKVTMMAGTSDVIKSPWPVTRVSITDPTIADVQVLTPNQVLLTAIGSGSTDLLMWGENEQVWHARVSVTADLAHVGLELKRIFPDSNLTIEQSRDLVIVSGVLQRAEDAPRLTQVLDGFGTRYVDATRIAGVQQVGLHVRVAEVSRRDIRALGMNAFFGGNSMFGGSTIGPANGGPLNPISIGAPQDAGVANIPFSFLAQTAVSSGVTLFTGFPGSDLQLFVQALAENQYVKLLAEPMLIALSGEEASFLAGGEFPIPVVQGSTTGGASISIEYKEFGVRLQFRPTVLGDDMIRLRVAPEVSDLSDLGAVEISGFSVPSVLTRRVDTTLELRSGQTFAMAGLLNSATSARSSRVPVLGELPVLGPLFRSVRYQRGETELVVLVTATLIEPTTIEGTPILPGISHVRPNDWDLFLHGKLHGSTPALPPVEVDRFRERGLDQLRGPGAWATFRAAPPRGTSADAGRPSAGASHT